jgi:hypothetical protein
VWRPKDLLALDPKLHVGRIAHTVGENKRVQIIDDAKKANIRILNPGLKRPAVVPEVTPEPTPTEPTPETKGEQKKTREIEKKEPEPAQQKPKKKAKAKTTTKRKSKK